MEIKPKKSLGQNFLRDSQVLQKIVDSADIVPDDFIIEIGPGEGVLTELLIKKAKQVIAIEIDNNLATLLEKKFSAEPNIKIINEDILKINFPKLLQDNNISNYKIVANIPYYITSPIMRLLLEQANQPTEIILTIQKEVAQRITAKAGALSILAVAIQYYSRPEFLFEVKKEAFFPVPKIDSGVIRLVPTRKLRAEKDKHFFQIVRSGFSARRKTLVNNLANGLQLDKKIVEEKLKIAGLSPAIRAQELDVTTWEKLVELF